MKRWKPILAIVFSILCELNSSVALASPQTDIMELEEQQMDTMREYCSEIMYRRLNAAREGRWRELVNQSKAYADSCALVEDSYALSKSYEDMAYALLNLRDPMQALRWAQACLDSNGRAVGCYARKAEILWYTGKYMEARSSISRGIMVGQQSIGMTKVQMERLRQRKPDPRAEPIYRRKYLRSWEQLDQRLTNLEESLQLIKGMQEGMDEASMSR